jgi:hypothetical protein
VAPQEQPRLELELELLEALVQMQQALPLNRTL